jgi:hypothetical protein
MTNNIECQTHGDSAQTFVCSHLTDGAAALGFNRDEPSEEEPFPDALCDDCNLIFETHGGWNEESEQLVSIQLICSGCYEVACIRNTRTDVTFEDLEGLRWKCFSCEEWHTGPCLDFTYNAPYHWSTEDENATSETECFGDYEFPKTFLNEDICILNGEYFFVRGIIHLPIIGTAETLRWGVWGSLSRASFEKLMSQYDDPSRAELEPMFSWLSTHIEDYDDTLNLKMYAHIQEPDVRPHFELELSDHPLSQEYHHGITPGTRAGNYEELVERDL